MLCVESVDNGVSVCLSNGHSLFLMPLLFSKREIKSIQFMPRIF